MVLRKMETMVDWVTVAVEAIGVLIFFIWIIVPIGEFKSIYRHLASQKKSQEGHQQGAKNGA